MKNTLVALGALTITSQAATIAWTTTGPLATASTISNAGTHIEAVNYGPASGTIDINGVTFTNTSAYQSTTFWSGAGGAASADAGINTLMDGHLSLAGGAGVTATLSLTGLTMGNTYQVQMVVGHDNRGCCSGRTYEFNANDTTADWSGSSSLSRGGGGSLIGTFIADGSTQDVFFRSAGGAGNDDPALSAYAVRETAVVPEPSSTALLGLGGLAMILRRRK